MPGILPQDNPGAVKLRAKWEFREMQMWEPIQGAKPIIANTAYIWRGWGFSESRIVADHFPVTVATSPITHALLELWHSPIKRWSLYPHPLKLRQVFVTTLTGRVCQKWHCVPDFWGCRANVTHSALLSGLSLLEPRHHVLRKPKQVPVEKIQVACPHPPTTVYIKFLILF